MYPVSYFYVVRDRAYFAREFGNENFGNIFDRHNSKRNRFLISVELIDLHTRGVMKIMSKLRWSDEVEISAPPRLPERHETCEELYLFPFYLHLSNMSGRINPFVLIHSVSNDSSDMSPTCSPRAKFVSTCMNCSYTFRLGSSISNEFCSKGKHGVIFRCLFCLIR